MYYKIIDIEYNIYNQSLKVFIEYHDDNSPTYHTIRIDVNENTTLKDVQSEIASRVPFNGDNTFIAEVLPALKGLSWKEE